MVANWTVSMTASTASELGDLCRHPPKGMGRACGTAKLGHGWVANPGIPIDCGTRDLITPTWGGT
jgi:hypothetical protein